VAARITRRADAATLAGKFKNRRWNNSCLCDWSARR
jgi:hypothetical protein